MPIGNDRPVAAPTIVRIGAVLPVAPSGNTLIWFPAALVR